MSVLCLNVCRLCLPNIMSISVCFKKIALHQSWRVLLDTASKFALFSVSSLKDKKLIRKQTYMKTETCKLYSRDLWTFEPKFIKKDPYNFELYRFKFGAFFWTQCTTTTTVLPVLAQHEYTQGSQCHQSINCFELIVIEIKKNESS